METLSFHLDRLGNYTSDELEVRLHGMGMSETEIAGTEVNVSGTLKLVPPEHVITLLNKV